LVQFHMLRRDAAAADDGFNFVSCAVWTDRAAFNGASAASWQLPCSQ
jgi:hypothetical protein